MEQIDIPPFEEDEPALMFDERDDAPDDEPSARNEEDFWTKAGRWFSGLWSNADKADDSNEDAREVKRVAEETRRDCEQLKQQRDAELTRNRGAQRFIIDFNDWWPRSNQLIDERVRRGEWTPEDARGVKESASRLLNGYVEEATRSYQELQRIEREIKDHCMGAMRAISGRRTWKEIRDGSRSARDALGTGRIRYRGAARERYPRLAARVRSGLQVFRQVAPRPSDPHKVHAFAGKSERSYLGAPPE